MTSRTRLLCGSILTAMGVVGTYASGVGQQRDRIQLNFAPAQEGSPLALLSVASDQGYLYRTVTVRNLSSVSVESVTFGIVLHAIVPKDAVAPEPTYRPGQPLAVSIAPGEIAKIEDRQWHSEQLLKIARAIAPQVDAELGVVSVKLANGTSWDFDAVTNNGFGGFKSQAALRVVPCQRKGAQTWLSRLGGYLGVPLLAQGHFVCTATANCLVCTNTGSSCTNSLCGQSGNPPCVNCPEQVCTFQ